MWRIILSLDEAENGILARVGLGSAK